MAKPTTARGRKVSKKKPSKRTKTDPSEILKNEIINGMLEKKAKDIVCIDLRNIKNAVADFFVICHADSKTHVAAISDSVEEQVHKKTGEWAHHREGIQNAEWILLDYFSVVAHIFRQEQRSFYAIEKVWADAEVEQVADEAITIGR